MVAFTIKILNAKTLSFTSSNKSIESKIWISDAKGFRIGAKFFSFRTRARALNWVRKEKKVGLTQLKTAIRKWEWSDFYFINIVVIEKDNIYQSTRRT